jgi:hypothetical protein
VKPLMKAMFVAGLTAVLCTAAVVPATAQSAGRLRVSIPFNFSMGKATLPAGDYTVQVLESGLLLFRSDSGEARQFALSTHGYSSKPSGSPHLVFTRCASDVFLNQVFLSGDGEYNQLLTSGKEQRLRRVAGEQMSLLIVPFR